jgi:hypothetical protein
MQDEIRAQLGRSVQVCAANGGDGEVEQTGGGVLVLYLNRNRDSARLGVTCPEKLGWYLVCFYPSGDGMSGEGTTIEERATEARLVAILKAFNRGDF